MPLVANAIVSLATLQWAMQSSASEPTGACFWFRLRRSVERCARLVKVGEPDHQTGAGRLAPVVLSLAV